MRLRWVVVGWTSLVVVGWLFVEDLLIGNQSSCATDVVCFDARRVWTVTGIFAAAIWAAGLLVLAAVVATSRRYRQNR